jgi:hypothetical protein
VNFAGFDPAALKELGHLPSLDAQSYAMRRDRLHRGLIEPARALIDEVVLAMDVPLTTGRGSVSPLHTDLRFAPPGAPRYKDQARLASGLQVLRDRHASDELEVAGDCVQKVPPPWSADHPRAELLPTHRWLVRHVFDKGTET